MFEKRTYIQQWTFKDLPGPRHLGPTAQDFRAAFNLGADDKTIATVDADGVALAAIQGLNEKLEEHLQAKEASVAVLEKRNALLEERVEKLERMLTTLAGSK